MCKGNRQRYEGQISMEDRKARHGGYYLAVGESLVLVPDKIRAGNRAVEAPRGCIPRQDEH